MTTIPDFIEHPHALRYLQRYAKAMDEIDAKAMITKTSLKEARTDLGRAWGDEIGLMMTGFNNTLVRMNDGKTLDMENPAYRMIMEWSYTSSREIAHINSFAKKLDKAFAQSDTYSIDMPEFVAIKAHMAKIPWFKEQLDRLNEAKAKIATPQQMKERKEADKPAVPPATLAQITMAKESIDDLVKDFLPTLTQNLTEMFIESKKEVDRQITETNDPDLDPAEKNKALRRLRDSSAWANAACMRVSPKPTPLCWANDWEAKAASAAHRSAVAMGEKFSAKQVEKLSVTLGEDNPMTKIDAHMTIRGGNIEAVMRPHFKDGHSFTMNTQVVYSWSTRGTFFARYPTTFHRLMQNDTLIQQGISQQEVADYMANPTPPKQEQDAGMTP